MSHFTVLVKFRGDLKTAGEKIDELLAPYYEEMRVDPYIRHTAEEVREEYNKCVEKYPEYADQTLQQFSWGWWGYELDENGNAMSTYNPDSRWDWYQVGGRWKGMLTLKDGAVGIEGEESWFGTGEETDCVDIAYMKDVVFDENFGTFAVLDEEHGWAERGSMGWWAVVTDEDDSWEENYEERFLNDYHDDTIIAIVDCHI